MSESRCKRATKAGGSSVCDHLWNWLVQKIHRQREKTSTPAKTPPHPSKETNPAVSVTGARQMKQLFPFVSMKSWRGIALGAARGLREGRGRARPGEGRAPQPPGPGAHGPDPAGETAATTPGTN